MHGFSVIRKSIVGLVIWQLAIFWPLAPVFAEVVGDPVLETVVPTSTTATSTIDPIIAEPESLVTTTVFTEALAEPFSTTTSSTLPILGLETSTTVAIDPAPIEDWLQLVPPDQEISEEVDRSTAAPVLADDAFVVYGASVVEGAPLEVRDAISDIADLGEGKKLLRIFTEPRLLGKNADQKLQVRPPGWNTFHQNDQARLAYRSTPGYRYQAPLGNGKTLTVFSGNIETTEGDLVLPQRTRIKQTVEDGGDIISLYKNVYPGVDVRFRDHEAERSRAIIINRLPPNPPKGQIIFWETYEVPEGTKVKDAEGQALENGDVTRGQLQLELSDGTVFFISGAVIEDATGDEREMQELEERVRITDNAISIGLAVEADYLLSHVLPITIDPRYYVCSNNTGLTPAMPCYSLSDLYVRTKENDRMSSSGDLFMGYYNESATKKWTREILVRPSAPYPVFNDLGTIQSAQLYMNYDRLGFGTFNGSITVAARQIMTSWSESTVSYKTVSSSLQTLSTKSVNTESASNSWVNWDITSAVQGWAGGGANNGILLEPSPAWTSGSVPSWPNRLLIFKSQEAGSNRGPYVDVTYQSPDYVSNSFSANNATVTVGNSISGSFQIRNSGAGFVNKITRAAFFLTPGGCITNNFNLSYQIGSVDDIQALPANMSMTARNFSFTVPTSYTIGGYCLSYQADTNDGLIESSESNNGGYIGNITVAAAPTPDLVPLSGSVSPQSVIQGQTITVNATVKNQGTANAGSSIARFYLDFDTAPVVGSFGPLISSFNEENQAAVPLGYAVQSAAPPMANIIAEQSVGNLNAGSQTTVSFAYAIPSGLAPGTYSLGYLLDVNNSVVESNENNNSYVIGPVAVNTVNDISAPSLSIITSRTYYSGNDDTLSLSANIKNNGSTSLTNVPYRIRLSQNGGGAVVTLSALSPASLNLPANSTQTITVSGVIPSGLPSAASYVVDITLDPGQTISEPNTTNNTVQALGTVYIQSYYSGTGGGGGTSQTAPNANKYIGYEANQTPAQPMVGIASFRVVKTTPDVQAENSGGDPVNTRNGAFEFEQTDFILPGKGVPLNFSRTYNSKLTERSARFGNGWSHSYQIFYYQDPATKGIEVYLGGSLASYFSTTDGGLTFSASKGDYNTLAIENGALVYRTQDATRYIFSLQLANNVGVLEHIIDRLGNSTDLTYNTVRNVPLLTTVKDAAGRQIVFSYPTDTDARWDKITGMTETANSANPRTVQYFYESTTTVGYNLTKVVENSSYQGAVTAATHVFTYDAAGEMLTYTDPRGTVLYSDYDTSGRVTKQYEHNPRFGAGDKRLVYTLTYSDVPDLAVTGSAHCTLIQNFRDATNHYDDYVCFNSDELKIYSQKGSTIERWTYDAQGLPATYTDGVGAVHGYTYDSLRRLTKEVLPDTADWHTETIYEYKGATAWLTKKTATATSLRVPALPAQTRVSNFNVDDTGLLRDQTDPLGNKEYFDYDIAGNITQFTDKKGAVTSYAYDAAKNYRTSETVNMGAGVTLVKNFSYDVYGNRTVFTDPRGNSTTDIYDTRGNVRQETNPAGDIRLFEYDVEDHRTKMTDELGRVTNFLYDTDLNASLLSITKVSSAGSIVNSRQYDYVGNLEKELDPLGRAVTYGYDSANRVITKTDSAKATTLVYDANGKIKKETNTAGARTDYFYDERGNKTETRSYYDAVNYITQKFVFDGFNQLSSATDGNGWDTAYTYDALGRLTQKTDALGGVYLATYDPVGNKIGERTPRASASSSLRNSLGNSTSYVYDAANRLTKTTNADDKQTLVYYDPNGNIDRVIDRQNADGSNNAHITRYVYDALNRKTAEQFADGSQIVSTYDKVGNLKTKKDQAGRTTVFAYDDFNRLIETNDPGANKTNFEYDLNGNKRWLTYPDGTKTEYRYDTSNRLEQVIDALGNSRSFGYDNAGNKISETDKNAHTTTYGYDKLNRLIRETNVAGTVTLHEYDDNSNRTSESVAGRDMVYVYDELNRPTVVYEPGTGMRKTFAYDANGNKAVATGKRNESTAFTYDKLDRLITKQLPIPISFAVTYQYDNWDNVLNVVDENDGSVRTYDLLNRPLVETKKFVSLSAPYVITRGYAADGQLATLTDAAGRVFDYTYDVRGLLKKVSFSSSTLVDYSYSSSGKSDTVTYGNGVVSKYRYDTLDRVASIESKGATGTVLFRQDYAYDGESNRTRLVSLAPGGIGTATTTYAYDALDQLTDVDYENVAGVGNDLTYRYDAYGNRSSAGSPLGAATYAYNNNSNLLASVNYNNKLTVASQYDQSGSLQMETYTRAGKPDKTVEYDWDDRDRLFDITYSYQSQPAFLPARPKNYVRFSYDDNNNRIAKIVGYNNSITQENCQSATPVNCRTTYYINDGLAVLNELAGTGTVTKSIVRGLEQVAEIDQAGAVTYVHQDVLGSAVLLTDQTGSVVQQYEYDPFGQVIGQAGPADTKYTYTGQEFDFESDLYYYNARYYNPRLGRFISRDPYLGRDGDSLSRNGYSYVKNNPLRYVDPSGEVSKTVGEQLLAQQQLWVNDKIYQSTNSTPAFCPSGADCFDFNPFAILDFTPFTGDISDVFGLYTGKTLFGQTLLTQQQRDDIGAYAMLPLVTSGQARLFGKILKESDSVIKMTEKGIKHVLERHTAEGAKNLNKSLFKESSREAIESLIRAGSNVPAQAQRNGNLSRVFDAGSNIGFDRTTGKDTSVITIITDKLGNLITSFPGKP